MNTKIFIGFLVVVMLGIVGVGIASADISDLIKVCPNGKVLNESENLNLSVKIFNPYFAQNATVTVSLPPEIQNLSATQQNLSLSDYGFNVINFPMKVKKNVQYKGDNVNISVDGLNTEWVNITRSKNDNIGDIYYNSSCSYSSNITSAYDVREMKVNYNENSDTIYFLILINGTVGGADAYIGDSEQYAISVDNDNNNNTIELTVKYENNTISINTTGNSNASQCSAYGNYSGNVIEIAITNASNVINLNGFNMKASNNATVNASAGISCAISDCTDWQFIRFCNSRNLSANISINFGNETITKNLTYEVGCIFQHQYCGDGVCNISIGENCANCCDCFESMNLSLKKTVNNSFIVGGENGTFNIEIKNNGMCSVYNLTLFDILPFGLENLTSTTKNLPYLNGNTLYLWNVSVRSKIFVKGDNISILADGNKNDWTNITRSKSDTIGDAYHDNSCTYSSNITSAYDIQEMKVNYNENSDTLYFLILTNGTVGGTDASIGVSEQYAISMDNDNNKSTTEVIVKYENNVISIDAANNGNASQCSGYGNYSGNVIEIALTNASKIVNLSSFNMKASSNANADALAGISCAISDCTEWQLISFCKDKTLTNFANLTAYSENGTPVNLNASANITVSCKGCNTTITCTCYRDADNDNYGNRTNNRTVSGCNTTCEALCTLQTTLQPLKYVTNPNDCNDNASNIHPYASEIYNGVDDNCVNGIDEGFCNNNEQCSSGYYCGSDHTCYKSSSYSSSSSKDSSNPGSNIITYTTPSGGTGCQEDTACGTLFCHKTNCYDSKGDEDKDNVNNSDERDKYKTDMLSNDTDKDGINDYNEIFVHKTDALHDADKDGDGIKDGDEILKYKTNLNNKDSDGDGVSDYDEIFTYKTNPLKDEDKDTDGIKDGEEILKYKTNPLSNDTDSDTISDYNEIFVHKTDPTKSDTDSDGIGDYDEIFVYKTDPTKSDTDSDGITDYAEIFTHKTDQLHDADNDNDGIKDSEEILKYKTNATSNDTDNDGIGDYDEIFTYAKYNLNPLSNDTDNDWTSDYDEIFKYKTNPGDAKSKPGNLDLWWLVIIVIILLLILLIRFLLAKRRKTNEEETQPKKESKENEGGGLGDEKLKQEASGTSQIAQEGGGLDSESANQEAYKPAEKGGQSGGLGGI